MRGFPTSEFQARLKRAQILMAQHGLDALFLTTEAEIRYFTGFLTRFWESPSRPWFLLVPASGLPVAVIPSIGRDLMLGTWIEDIRCWSAPDLQDDGVSLLANTIEEVLGSGVRIGMPDGHETHLRMPFADLERVKALIAPTIVTSDEGIVRSLRMIKSKAEIAKIETACAIAGRAFARVPELAEAGIPLEEVFRRFQILCLEEGADWVPYLAGASDQGGYRDVISPATEAPIQLGDVLMLDTGLVWDGYFCDYDRNWSLGAPSAEVASAHAQLIEASNAAFEIAMPGATAADLFQAMNRVVSTSGEATEAGRLGHGLGLSLTEWPSLIATDHTVLEAGMVLTLEPGIAVADKILVHEENIVITDCGALFISPKIGPEITIL
ncbi:MAG: Xaa-Pro peptidase family protein [Pseudomonadota bacterium]